jgi:predicted outer membrane repeat protein
MSQNISSYQSRLISLRIILLCALLGFSLFFSLSVAQAAAITVDAVCSLADAITAANSDTATGGCPAGSGADTLTLTQDVTLSAALPDITSAITIEGQEFTVNGAGGAYPVFNVTAAGNLTLNKINVTNGGNGGVVSAGSLAVNDSTISGNTRSGSGGGIYSTGSLSVDRATISGNTASGTGSTGGGVYQAGSSATLVNTTVSGNQASGYGGGIYAHNTSLSLLNATIAVNGGVTNGGGVVGSATGGTCNVTFSRTILSGNTSSDFGTEYYRVTGTGGTVNVTVNNYNVFGHNGVNNNFAYRGYLAPGTTDVNATSNGSLPTALASILNTTLANNGTNPHPDTHALPLGSPAIDRAPTAACSAAPVNLFDARRGTRNISGLAGDTGTECDSGAFEYGATQTPTAIELNNLAVHASVNWHLAALALGLLLATLISLVFLLKRTLKIT